MLEVRQGANLPCSSGAIFMSCTIPGDILETCGTVFGFKIIRGGNFVVKNRYW